MEENVHTIVQTIAYGGAELLAELLGSDLHAYAGWQDEYGQTFLHLACAVPGNPCVRVLLNAGAEVNACTDCGSGSKTPLHLSAHVNDLEACRLLVDRGADLFARDVNGNTPLLCAQMNNCRETSVYLLDEIEKRRLKMIELQTALMDACRMEDLRLIEQVLRQSEACHIYGIANETLPDGGNLLFRVCQAGWTDVAELLVHYGAGAVINPSTFCSPLYMAVSCGHFSTVKFLLTRFPELAQVATSAEQWLPIHEAAKHGRLDIVKLLLEHPFPKYVLNSYKDDSGLCTYKMVFDVNSADSEGRTALMIAAEGGHSSVVAYLLRFVVMARAICPNDEQANSMVDGKPVHPVKSDLHSCKGYTALQMAVFNGKEDVVNTMLDNGVDVNVPLGYPAFANLKAPFEDCADTSGALIVACHRNNLSMADVLLQRGSVDMDNKALRLCIAHGYSEMVAKLLSYTVFADPEYRVNKRAMDMSSIVFAGKNCTLLPSGLYPSTAVMLNWHNADLSELKEAWLREAARRMNPRWRIISSAHMSCFVNTAITRIDISKNKLTTLPGFLFTLPSLRILNASNNSITGISVGMGDVKASSFAPLGCCLEEVHLERNLLAKVPAALFTLPAMVTLNLASNVLEELPANLWDCPRLKDLNVADNRLSFLPLPRPDMGEHRGHLCPYQSANEEDAFANAEQEPCEVEKVTDSADSLADWRRAEDSIRVHELCQHSLWRNCPDLVRPGNEDSLTSPGGRDRVYHLSSLNLANNRFESVPQNLSCLAPGLSRLNMARNLLREIGAVSAYPAGLKHLDLSGNKIRRWFTVFQVVGGASVTLVAHEGRSPSRSPHSMSSRRSQSVSRLSRLSISSVERAEVYLPAVCSHRSHQRLENLKTLILADNCLESIVLGAERLPLAAEELLQDGSSRKRSSSTHRSRRMRSREKKIRSHSIVADVSETRQLAIFPNLSMLDLSRNSIVSVPATLSALQALAVLNLSGNRNLSSLPAELGMLSKLWNLNLNDCNLAEPLNALFDSNKCKTIDIVGYLKSVLEDSKPYARLKLMIVGVQGIGKTSLLEQLRAEGSVPRRAQSEGWASRMGTKSANEKTATGGNISTVGVDVNEWTYQPKRQRGRSRTPITFRTWDFGGQREYYATHQYFLSKRSIYLVVWRLTDGDAGISEFTQWLINIQARAPNSPVIIVGTHMDAIKSNSKKFPPDYVQALQSTIRDRFMAVSDPDKRGIPRVVESLAVSCTTRENVRALCDVIYSTAAELRSPGSKEPLIDQRVPSAYIALEEVVVKLAAERKANGQEPVMTAQVFKAAVQKQIKRHLGRCFRDNRELNQAVVFLHENGVLLHYDDATLKDLYFLDPQWLCDILAHVITIREINPFAKGGIMRVEDLKVLFKATKFNMANLRNYALNLLQKFEVALTWDNQTLLIPSLLPDEYQLRGGYPGCNVKIPVNPKHLVVGHRRNCRSLVRASSQQGSRRPPGSAVPLVSAKANAYVERRLSVSSVHFSNDGSCLRRLYAMLYFPCGFWSRFMTRMLGDDKVHEIFESYFEVSSGNEEAATAGDSLLFQAAPLEWSLWQTGMEVNFLGTTLVSFKQFLPLAQVRDVDYRNVKIQYRHEAGWSSVVADQLSILEIYMPQLTYEVTVIQGEEGDEESEVVKAKWKLVSCRRLMSRLLATAVDILDTLLEDWYPSLGTRFIHTSEGRYLVTRLVPCTHCITDAAAIASRSDEDAWTLLVPGGSKSVAAGDLDQETVEAEALEMPCPTIYSFTIEECILAANDASAVFCPDHGALSLNAIAPDAVFLDLSESQLIVPNTVKRGKLLGRGAFGFVFKAAVKLQGSHEMQEVALKMLQPVDPGFGAKASALAAFRAASVKWKRDPVQNSCRAYCTARQELNVLLKLKHPNIAPLIGVCAYPLSLAFGLASLGSLGALLKNYKRSGARLNWTVIQETASQVAKALEYLHQRHVIYRDLKSENVLVWQFPPPFSQLTNVEVKLGDYGISRSALPTGNMKGFGGTEGFMAPEIIRYNGEEEYTERVDCFSFGMFLYEMYTLKLPFEGQEQVKELILDGGRPTLCVKETQYPLNFLDVMLKCWSQLSSERPSSSQLVSLTTAPEFGHLLDVVSLEDADVSVAAGEAFLVEESGSEDGVQIEAELWLSRADGSVCILSSDGHSWFEYKSTIVNEDSIVTALCLVGDQIWLAEFTGLIRVYCVKTYTEMFNFLIGPSALVNGCKPEPAVPLRVEQMFYLDRLNQVVLTLCEPAAVLICQSSGRPERQPIMSSVPCPAGEIVSSTLFPVCERTYDLWVCNSSATLFTFEINRFGAVHKDTFEHVRPRGGGEGDIETAVLTSSSLSDSYVWSYLNPGSTVYQWDTRSKMVKARLNCSKIVPCSESLNSMNIEEGFDPRCCQVSAMYLLERDECTQLYVGTTLGVVIVAEADQLKPITAFRPHCEDVRIIGAFIPRRRAVLCFPSSKQSSSVGSDRSNSAGGKSLLRSDDAASSKSSHRQLSKSPSDCNAVCSSNFLITVGKGYRDLIGRFMDTSGAKEELPTDRHREFCAVLWRTEDWSNF